MLSTVHTYAVVGIDAVEVRAEVDLAKSSFPRLVLVGLPDAVVRESRERITAALRNQGFRFPDRKITVNLAPAGLPKAGGSFDLPIAIGILVASGQVPDQQLGSFVWAGELSLGGKLQPIRGALSMAMCEAARKPRPRTLILPRGNGEEAASAGKIDVGEAANLKEIARYLFNGTSAVSHRLPAPSPTGASHPIAAVDMADVRGQRVARRAIEIAAAGGHNLLMLGSPGTGKSMLAERLPSILPPMSRNEQLEVTRVHSIAGLLGTGKGLCQQRPFRAPHHSVSEIGLVGGGRPPTPGEASLAHRGVLFLDEFPEFRRHALESLRQPIEAGEVTIARAGYQARFPCRCQLVAAMNPCPCGRRLDPRGGCRCSRNGVDRYLGRISGPLLDRIDLHVEMSPVGFKQLALEPAAEDSTMIRARVRAAWERQQHRYRSIDHVERNADMALGEIHSFCKLDPLSLGYLRMAVSRLRLSPRAFHRVQRIARTIADLAAAAHITEEHVSEAISYRKLDRGRG